MIKDRIDWNGMEWNGIVVDEYTMIWDGMKWNSGGWVYNDMGWEGIEEWDGIMLDDIGYYGMV